GEEHLVLYASDGLDGAERAATEAHVVGCDACLLSVVRVRRRLAVAGDFAAAIPPAVQHRAGLALERGLRELERESGSAEVRVAQHHHVGLLERLSSWLRVPVLVPAAVAAGALLALVSLQQPTDPTAGERSRAVAPASATLRVRAVEAAVYSRPSMQSQIIATVKRDTRLEVAGEERGWYEVRLEGGSAGWVAQEAFE
ncbi:MAG: SH3 domain-containing protein, partial [Candidatus Binatia bacterium]